MLGRRKLWTERWTEKRTPISLLAEAGVTKKHGSVTVVIEGIFISAFTCPKLQGQN